MCWERDSRSETISGNKPRCNKAGLELRTFLKGESKEVPAVEEARDVQWRSYSERNQ